MGLEVEVVAETNKFDVIVIGGGIAGMTASSIVTQGGLKSCFLEKDVPGGKLMRIEKLNNFPSNPGIAGKDLAVSFFKQVTEEMKTTYAFGDVQTIKPKNGLFYLFTADGQTWEAKAIIIAVGTIDKKLNIDGEDKYINNGVSYCVLCDGSLAKDKKVVLVGSTLHLDYLSKFTKEIVTLRANEIKSIDGNGSLVTGITKSDGSKVSCNFVFIENGYEPNIGFVPNEIKLDDQKQIIVDENMASPYMEGVFACGDCINRTTKQVIPAMQEASTAAESAIKYVKSKHW